MHNLELGAHLNMGKLLNMLINQICIFSTFFKVVVTLLVIVSTCMVKVNIYGS